MSFVKDALGLFSAFYVLKGYHVPCRAQLHAALGTRAAASLPRIGEPRRR
jgi:hypothetical protein